MIFAKQPPVSHLSFSSAHSLQSLVTIHDAISQIFRQQKSYNQVAITLQHPFVWQPPEMIAQVCVCERKSAELFRAIAAAFGKDGSWWLVFPSNNMFFFSFFAFHYYYFCFLIVYPSLL